MRLGDLVGDLGRHDVPDVLAEKLFGRHEQIARIFGVVVQVDAITRHRESQMRQGAQQRMSARLVCRKLLFG